MLLRQILDNFSELVVIVLLILVFMMQKKSLHVTGKGILSHYIFKFKIIFFDCMISLIEKIKLFSETTKIQWS